MKTYPKYKDSNIPWIGRIPGHWTVKKLKNLAILQTGNTPPKEYDLNRYYADKGLLWVKPDNLNDFCDIKTTNEYLNEEGSKIARIVPAGTPLVCCIGSIGKFGFSKQSVAFNQQINAVLFNNLMDKRFGLYQISCQEEQHWFYANGNVVQILNTQNQGKIMFAVPPLPEQTAIAAYLDRKCSAIDRVIEAESRIIEKLKEYRQSLITEAVSHGLNPHAPMKASGIPWIGRIPRHWELRKLKNILKLRNEKKEYSGESYIGLENIESHSGKYIPPKEIIVDGISNRFFCGDVIFGKLRPYLAKAAITDFDGLCSSEFLVMKEFKGDRRYLLGILLSYWFIDIVNSSTYGTKMPRASWEFIGNMYVPYPPLSEQISIADFLDKKCSAIDSTISKKQQIIEKMTEYKKSLIYECVTGKLSI